MYLEDKSWGHYYRSLKCDLFYDIDDLDFAGFADGNTPYSCLSDMRSVLGQLKGSIDKIFDWLTN